MVMGAVQKVLVEFNNELTGYIRTNNLGSPGAKAHEDSASKESAV